MGEIVTLKLPGERWATGPLLCLGCRHKWTASYKPPKEQFECPACGLDKGVVEGLYQGAPGDSKWVCACGNSYFEYVIPSRAKPHLLCVACGDAKGDFP